MREPQKVLLRDRAAGQRVRVQRRHDLGACLRKHPADVDLLKHVKSVRAVEVGLVGLYGGERVALALQGAYRDSHFLELSFRVMNASSDTTNRSTMPRIIVL
jgi:hypothetical protein